MKKTFRWIGNLIEKHPVKVLLTTILLFAILIAGVANIRMATGNETLVRTDNEVFISNKDMEASFGGDPILVLFTDDTGGNLLSLENIRKMWNIEQKFKYEDNIFSFMSPASIVHQMTEMQSEEIMNRVITLSDGLDEMGLKMIDIGNNLNSKEMIDTDEIESKINGLAQSTEVFHNLISGQDKLNQGAKELQGGLLTASDGLSQVANQLKELSNLAVENQQLQMKLTVISENISKSSQAIQTMGNKTTNIQEGAQKTSHALSNISNQLSNETASMKELFGGSIAPDELKEMATGFLTMGEKLQDISEALEIFHDKSDMMVADIPGSQKELDNILYDENSELRTMFSDVMIDNNNALMVIKLQGNLKDEDKDQLSEDIGKALEEEGFDTISYIISGKPVLDSSLRTEMKSNMVKMVGMAVIIMLIVLLLVFKVRWRMLSLGIILISVIATLGFMGILSVPITMVSMAVFPILIGLGIDYSIQFHNRYEEEKSVKKTLSNVGKAVAVAVLATVLGFVSLYVSPVPMIQDFGKMLTIGVIISFIGSIFLLTPILCLRDKTGCDDKAKNFLAKKDTPEKETLLDKILKFTTKAVIKFAVPILIIVIGLSVAGFMADKNVGVETDIETFMPQDMDALEDMHVVRDTVGSTDQIAIYMKADNILTEENISWIQTKSKEIEEKYDEIVVKVNSIDTLVENLSSNENLSHKEYIDIIDTLPKKMSSMFINDEKTEAVILLSIEHLPTEDLQTFAAQLENEIKDAPMEIHITGKSILDIEMVNGLTSGRIKMTVLGLLLVFAALLVIYRNPIKALIPIFPVGLIVGMSSGIMYLLGIKFTPITATLGALVLGMGSEMTIMLLERYLEEKKLGKGKHEAMLIAVTMIGKAIVASGLTTVGGFSVLMLSEFVILKDFGLMTVINISLALISTFVILPPVIILFDKLILGKE